MKSWVKPVTEVQKFEANEYVAACWGVGCDVSWSNDYEKWQGDYDNGVTHSSAHCGNSSKLATPISNGGLTLTPPGYSTGIR